MEIRALEYDAAVAGQFRSKAKEGRRGAAAWTCLETLVVACLISAVASLLPLVMLLHR